MIDELNVFNTNKNHLFHMMEKQLNFKNNLKFQFLDKHSAENYFGGIFRTVGFME